MRAVIAHGHDAAAQAAARLLATTFGAAGVVSTLVDLRAGVGTPDAPVGPDDGLLVVATQRGGYRIVVDRFVHAHRGLLHEHPSAFVSTAPRPPLGASARAAARDRAEAFVERHSWIPDRIVVLPTEQELRVFARWFASLLPGFVNGQLRAPASTAAVTSSAAGADLPAHR